MITRMRNLDECGIAAAEFALVLPALLLLLFGTIEFGMIMYGREIVTNAAREGVRAGIVQGPNKPNAGASTTIANGYITGTGLNQGDVTFTPTGAGLSNPNTLTVTARYEYHFLIPYIPAILPGISDPLIITTQVVMRHE